MHSRPVAARGLLPVALLLSSVLLVGCNGDDEATSTPAAASSAASGTEVRTTTTESAAHDAESSAPPFDADTSPDSGEASADARVTVSDIRVGRHEGFDRVVFQLGGIGTPGWDVRYVDSATSQGSGDQLEVAGSAVLRVTITGAGYPYDTGVEEFSPSEAVQGAGTEVVTEVAFDGTYEGTTVAFVGTTERAAFRVYRLADPTRIVVDLRDPA
jgi:hypothetical protein